MTGLLTLVLTATLHSLAGGDEQVEADLLDGLAERLAAQDGRQHVVGDGLGPAAVLVAQESRGAARRGA
ncbi:hypothetical protein ACWFRK_42120, partial [Streptomyces sp. NPDC055157]